MARGITGSPFPDAPGKGPGAGGAGRSPAPGPHGRRPRHEALWRPHSQSDDPNTRNPMSTPTNTGQVAEQLADVRAELDESRRLYAGLEAWLDDIKAAVRAHPDGEQIMRDAVARCARSRP